MNNNTNRKKKKQKKAIPPKTKTRTPQKTTHEIKRPIVEVEEVERYLQHIQNNPDLDEFSMNSQTICTQIAECEVAYFKIRHTNVVLAEVDMKFYHSLPPVQVLLGEMTRLESLAMNLKARDNTTTTTNTTTATGTPTVDRPKSKSHTDTDTISTIESYNNNNNNNNKKNDNHTTVDDDTQIAEHAQETKRQHKQAIEREQVWHRNNNKRMRFETSEQETEKEKEKETARRQCETARLDLTQKLPQKQQQVALKQKQHQLYILKLWETQKQQAQQLHKQKEQEHEQMKQQQERRQQQQQLETEQQQISENRKKISAAQRDKGKQKKKLQCVSIGICGEKKCSKDPEKFGTEVGKQMIANRFGDG